MKSLLSAVLLILLLSGSFAQKQDLVELLGYPKGSKLLIIHADDAAVSHSTNQAVMDAFEKGNISSTAIMVPCPWFPEFADYAKNHPDYDYGIHLTFSAEWNTYKWGSVAPADKVSSLLNKEGYFYPTTGQAVDSAKVSEVETEVRAQIDKAIAAGIKPSHFDTHMNTIVQNIDLFRIYIKLSVEYKVPILLAKDQSYYQEFASMPEMKNLYFIDSLIEAKTEVDPVKWKENYIDILNNLQPGIHELIFHLAYYTDETKAMTKGFEFYDAEWRRRDVEFAFSDEFKKALKENNINVVTWKQIQATIYK